MDNCDMKPLIRKMLEIAERKGINQADLARAAGTAAPRVTEWKAEKGTPSIEQALRIARLLGVPLDYLADDSLTKPPSGPDPEDLVVLRVVHALGLQPDEAIRRLSHKPGPGNPIAERDLSPSYVDEGKPKVKK